MAKSNNWTVKDLQDKNLVEYNGKFVNVKTLVDPDPKRFKSGIEHFGLVKNSHEFTGKPDKLKSFQEKQREDIEAWKAQHPNLGTPKENRKILNAVKVEQNGIKFDSRLELYCYNALKAAGIDFEFQVKYELQPRFKYNGEAIRAITLTVDFRVASKNLLIDTKGFQTQQGTIRWKMLKWWLLEDRFENNYLASLPIIEQPKNKKEVDLLINRILYEL